MYKGKKIGAVIIAYNAEATLKDTVDLVPRDMVDHLIICDDGSTDRTKEIGLSLGVPTFSSDKNYGPGANTKRGFDIMLEEGDIDIVVLLHGDNQYDPSKIPGMVAPIAEGQCDVVLGARTEWSRGSMPLYKQLGNRVLSAFQNAVFGQKLSDYATGYKAFAADVLKTINYPDNKDDFEFDEQLNAQVIMHGFRVMNVDVPTRYFPEARSIGFMHSVIYGLQTVRATMDFLLYKTGFRTRKRRKLFRKRKL